MSDKPILFSGPMVRALLAGTKTQTRRTISTKQGLRPNLFDGTWADSYVLDPGNQSWRDEALRYHVGDRLWVKETSTIAGWGEDGEVWVTYSADNSRSKTLYPDNEDFLERLCNRVEKAGAALGEDGMYQDIPPSALVRPSIFMPRWASRITLTITDARVERLQSISDEDAIAEGIERVSYNGTDPTYAGDFGWRDYRDHPHAVVPFDKTRPALSYESLWSSINGPGSWDANPWVAAYTFTVKLGNIDAEHAP